MRFSYQVFALWAAALLISMQIPGGELHGSVVPSAQSNAVGVFHLGVEALPEVELSRPGCPDQTCP